MEKCTQSPPILKVEHLSLQAENMILESQWDHPTKENPDLRSQAISAVDITEMSESHSFGYPSQVPGDDSANISKFLAQMTTCLSTTKLPKSPNDDQAKVCFDHKSQQMESCQVISGPYQSTLMKQNEKYILEFLCEPTNREVNSLENIKVDKGDNPQQNAIIFKHLSSNETNQRDHSQEELPDSIEKEVSGTGIMDNLPDLITQCIQLDKKCNNKPELLQSETQLPMLTSLVCNQALYNPKDSCKENSIQLHGGHPLRTPVKRAHQQETHLCLYCSQSDHFTRDCLAKRFRAPQRINNPTHK
ncbi:retrotransposon Gag-like protein 4 [Sorex araneus]|uniref:retrotransposon Gag-like protein 4 n=1 Tax=Sorex araneus TaxID=42254 RepID=UPI002433B013|nr:retrotransposon Gag-like protein 4 [Sorex araneus]